VAFVTGEVQAAGIGLFVPIALMAQVVVPAHQIDVIAAIRPARASVTAHRVSCAPRRLVPIPLSLTGKRYGDPTFLSVRQ